MRRHLFPILVLTLLSLGHRAACAGTLPNVAVLPLSSQGVDSASAQVLTDALSDELLKTGKVRVMERSQMAEVLKEQGFQQSGACDQSACAVQMGKLLGIDKIVVGSLGRFGSTYTVSLRGVDVGTGEVVASVRKLQKGEMDAILTDLLPKVAREMGGRLVDGGNAKAVQESTGSPAPSSASDSAAAGSGKSHWGWWLAGGAVVAGGAVAAVLLTQGGSSSEGGAATSTPGTGSWQTKVEW